MALVIVRHRAAASLLQRQARLRAVQCLDLAFLIHAQHQGLLWRIQIQADHIGQLLQKPRVTRQLETLDSTRLQIVTAPDGADRGLAHALALRHESATPVRHPLRLGVEGCLYDSIDLLCSIGGLAPAAGRDRPQTLQAVLREPGAPQDHRLPIGLQQSGDRTVRLATRGRQHDPASQHHLLWGSVRRQPLLNLCVVAGVHRQGRNCSGHG